MTIIIRTWKKAYPDTLWSIWDGGSEFWELKNGHLRHFSVIERYKEGELIIEKVQLLQESPIPLEAVRQTILGWEVDERNEALEVIPPPQKKQMAQVQEWAQRMAEKQSQAQAQTQTQTPAETESQAQVQTPQSHVRSQPQAQAQKQARPQARPQPQPQKRKGAFQPLTQGPAFLPDNAEDASQDPPQHSQSQLPDFAYNPTKNSLKEGTTVGEEHTEQEQDETSLCSQALESKEGSLQDSYTAPTELWSALSQWIPANALYQPSLHHQAFLELSGTQEKSYLGKKDSEANLRQKGAPRPYVAPSRNSRTYQPKTFVQQTRGPCFPRTEGAGPLFI